MILRIRSLAFARIVATLAVVVTLSTAAHAVNDPIAYWDFLSLTGISSGVPGTGGRPTTIAPTTGTGNLSLTGFLGNIDDLTGTALNADTLNPPGNGNVALGMLPGTGTPMPGNGGFVQFEFSMLGRTGLGISYATQSSSTGFNTSQWSYSTDGSTFTDFGTPVVPGVGAYGKVGSLLTSALDNDDTVFLRYTVNGGTGATGTHRLDNVQLVYNATAPTPLNGAALPQAGDIVIGTSVTSAPNTLEIVRGPLGVNTGVRYAGPWQTQNFIQATEFDNYAGVLHNAKGNLLGVNFSNSGIGDIYSFATAGPIPSPTPQKIGNVGSSMTNPALGHTGLANSTLAGLSVSPDNTKIALNGVSAGNVIVFDYNDGDGLGMGASLSGGRETARAPNNILSTAETQGTAWLDNDTVLVVSTVGNVYEVDVTPSALTPNLKANIAAIGGLGTSDAIGLAYRPDISPYVYVMFSGFVSPTSITKIFVLDPANNYAPVDADGDDFSNTSQTGREIALDKDGNLLISAFDSTITYIPAANALNPGTITDNSSIFYYQSPVAAASFIGFDVGFGPKGDYNNDGKVDAADYVVWKETNINGAQGYTDWVANFGKGVPSSPGSGSSLGGGAAVPEPACVALLLVGIVGLCQIRRRAA